MNQINNISASQITNIGAQTNTGFTFSLNYSPSENKAIITLYSTEALKDKKFLYTVTRNLARDKTVLVDCGEFTAQDSIELLNLRNGMWSPREYKTTKSREIVTALLPDGDSPQERTNSKFAGSVWNASRGERGGEVDFTSTINVLQLKLPNGKMQSHLFIIMQRINKETEISLETFQDDDSGGLIELEKEAPLFNPVTDDNNKPKITLTVEDSSELAKGYFLDELLGYTYKGFEVTLAQEIHSPNALKIVEESDNEDNEFNTNEIQITYSIIEDTMQDIFTNLISSLVRRGKSIYIAREDPFFQQRESDYIIVKSGKSQNKARIILSDFDDSDYNNVLLAILQKLLTEGKIVALYINDGPLDLANQWKISSLTDTLSNESINVELIIGVDHKTDEPVYVLLPAKNA